MKIKIENIIRFILLGMIGIGIAGVIVTLKSKNMLPGLGGPGIERGVKNDESMAKPVRTARAVIGTIDRVIKVNGSIMAEKNVKIYSDVSGKLTSNLVSVGDYVKEGQTVAWVDPSRPGDVYSASPVTATISGTVTAVNWNKGDTVRTTDPVIEIGNLDSLLIEINIPERYINQLVKDQAATIILEAFPGQKFDAAVTEISPVLDAASRTLGIKLKLLTDDRRIKAGMFATATLAVETRKNVLLIPSSAIVMRSGEQSLFVIKEEKGILRMVKTGLDDGKRIEIISGLASGEEVIIEGQGTLNNGDPVKRL